MARMFYPNNDEVKKALERVTTLMRSELDPDYIIMSGSFGKQSWLFNGSFLLSDFEIVFLSQRKWSAKKKKEILLKLNEEFDYDFNLKGYITDKARKKILSNYSFKNPGYISLDFFDSINNPIFLYKKDDNLGIQLDTKMIPIWEAWRLLVNRIGDLLVIDYLESKEEYEKKYFWLKVYESIADAYLIVQKKYVKSIKERNEIFTESLFYSNLDSDCINSFGKLKSALNARESHQLDKFELESETSMSNTLLTWLFYVENKLLISEGIMNDSSMGFASNYLNDSKIQYKYLGFDYSLNKMVSNGIRLAYNPGLLSSSFRFLNHKVSWRHIILITVSTFFKERMDVDLKFEQTRFLLSLIDSDAKIEKMSEEELAHRIVRYWKKLR